ncbi:Retrovirus-related Pol polyprotein from transposon 297, partial [Trametes pubescens]
MVNVVDADLWPQLVKRLGEANTSARNLRMANGAIVASHGRWTGDFDFEGVHVRSSFEIFPSKGAWSFLIGKPMLEALRAQHDYEKDTIQVRGGQCSAVVRNQRGNTWGDRALKAKGLVCTVDAKMCLATIPLSTSLCEVPESIDNELKTPETDEPTRPHKKYKVMVEDVPEEDDQEAQATAETKPCKKYKVTVDDVPDQDDEQAKANSNQQNDGWYIGPDTTVLDTALSGLYEFPVNTVHDATDSANNIYTRTTDPFKSERVQAIVDAVQIGDDISTAERERVQQLIRKYADCFALSIKEVTPIPGAVHTLNVPPDTTFSRRVHQKPLTPPQRAYVHKKIDELIEAGAIEPCSPSEVKCIAPITLAHKAHEGTGLTMEELRRRVNEECEAASLPNPFDVPKRPEGEQRVIEPPPTERKWRICQNFGEINKVTEIAPMPQGDIRQKQLNLSGHQWVCTFDFASGFYAVVLAEESRAYACFYVEGRGYLRCVKMPFGLTGAPATFAYQTVLHLHDLLIDDTMELFVDDGGTAGDDFDELLGKIERILVRIRECGLSLSPTKCHWFMTEAVFAGALVGPNGVTPDRAKLTAVVDWKKPEDALNLGSFLGLTSHFRDLIKDYARVEAPLRDLLRDVHIPKGAQKGLYRRAMQNYKFGELWNNEHDEAFLKLKTILTSEPVLHRPDWDGRPFIVTTDGSKDGFGAVLAQRFTDVLPSGKVVKRTHPIAFASKRTSRTEEKYKSFISEFAALKFGLDKFTDIIWGFPVELETDCQALRDVLSNGKLSSTHARWRDGILAHQIVDVRHIPGKLNTVADGLSRVGENAAREAGDGSEWTVSEDWETNTGLVNDIFQVNGDSDTSEVVDTLLHRFRDEPLFIEVIQAIMNTTETTDERKAKRARHRAEQYSIDDGKLWRTKGGTKARAQARIECITKAEAVERAREQHTQQGHWGRDAIKIALMDKYWSPKLDASILDGIKHCAKCKNFGATHLHSLLDPITRRHPFELLVGDYLSLPDGKGGFKNVGVYLDTFSQHVWAFKYKTAGTAKTTNDALRQIFHGFVPPETFMTDGGKHFDNQDVRAFCREWDVGTQ